jgi:TPR repeat protein
MTCALPRNTWLLSLLLFGCHEWVEVRECPPGQQEHEDRCLPTPTVVFLRCVEAFRTEKVEHDRSKQLAIDASAPTGSGTVGGSLQRTKADRERREYTEMSDGSIGIAVEECRRQEQAERESRLAAALQDAEAARTEMQAARADAATAGAKLESLERSAEALRDELGATTEALDQTKQRIAELDPCAAESWEACTDKGVVAHDAGDHAGAARMFDAACKGGHAQACDNRGRMLEHGLGVPTDSRAAFRHYARACELGSIDACVSEGVLAQAGRGTMRDPERAARRFAKACRADSARGCWNFGDALARGLGVDRDEGRAAASFARACELGEADACEDAERHAPPIASAAADNPAAPTR